MISEHDDYQLVEVGPGAGALTKYFTKSASYLGIEFDPEKVDYLKKNFPNKTFIQEDILKYQVDQEILFCGNYPYNISGPIIFKTLENKSFIPVMIGMFQKEVSQRIVAVPRTKAYGILSVLCQCFYDCTLLFDIPAGAFQPPPKVVSSLIKMVRNQNPYQIEDFNKFKVFVKTAFNQRRKTLNNSLKSLQLTIPETYKSKRPEELTPEDFALLFHQLYS